MTSAQEVQQLRAYVTAMNGREYQEISPETLILTLTHSNLQQRHVEIRFSKRADTLESLQLRIHRNTGTPVEDQWIQMMSTEGEMLWDLPDTSALRDKPLGYFSLPQNATVHCIDTNRHSASANGQYEDVSLVQKYRMSDEEYDQRRGTIRDWCRQQRKVDPTFSLQKHAQKQRQLHQAKQHHRVYGTLLDGFRLDENGQVVMALDDKEDDQEVPKKETVDENEEYGPSSISPEVQVGCRCEVQPGSRRGVVAYVGPVAELKKGGGHWVGVVLDEPQAMGSLDGVVRGKVYFSVPSPKRGAFVRGTHVQVGDFPERDFLDEDEEDEL